MAEMQSYRTNDRVTLKYIDTGAGDSGEEKKPLLILVRLLVCFGCFVCVSRLCGNI